MEDFKRHREWVSTSVAEVYIQESIRRKLKVAVKIITPIRNSPGGRPQ